MKPSRVDCRKAILFILFLLLPACPPETIACTIVANGLNFGVYISNQDTEKTGTGSIEINCAISTPYTVELDGGLFPQAYPGRAMSDGFSHYLDYFLYQDASHTLPWHLAANGAAKGGTGAGGPQVLTVYGTIPAFQAISPGSYNDAVTATVNW